MRSTVVLLVPALVLGMFACRSVSGDVSTDTTEIIASSPTPQPMRTLSSGLATAFGASFGRGGFADEGEREQLRAVLQSLADDSESLLAHGRGLGETTDRVREAMAREAKQALSDFDAGELALSQRRVHQLVEHCFACHTRLPAPERAALDPYVAPKLFLEGLDLEQRVFYLVATRQFEPALQEIEAALRPPGELGGRTTWLFEAHLKLSLRVDGSYGRARDGLADSLAGGTAPPYLEARVRSWIESLDELDARGPMPVDLTTARRLIDEGRARNEFPADVRGLVHFVAASGVLLQVLQQDADGQEGEARAEAYYLLGIAESHISTGLWTDQTEYFLETAIRLHPRSTVAAQAYAFLQEYVILKHSSASRTLVPESVRAHLDELAYLAVP